MSSPRRITNTINTIPAYNTLNGTVTSNSTDTTVLNYSGTADWMSIFEWPTAPPPSLSPNPFSSSIQMLQEPHSKIWLYIPSGQHLVEVLGVTNTGTNTWAIQLATGVGSLASAPVNYVKANLRGYYFLNDGGASGKANNITILDGEWLDDSQLSPSNNRADFVPPVLIDATGTDFLVTENL